jgi:hypothetical protein
MLSRREIVELLFFHHFSYSSTRSHNQTYQISEPRAESASSFDDYQPIRFFTDTDAGINIILTDESTSIPQVVSIAADTPGAAMPNGALWIGAWL